MNNLMNTKWLSLLLLAITFLACSLFRKTTKTTVIDSKEMKRLTESGTVAGKATGKYSELFTFRKDGSVYQYQYVKDTSNEVVLEAVEITEKETEQQKQVVKQDEPVKFWLYAGLGLLLLTGFGRWFLRADSK